MERLVTIVRQDLSPGYQIAQGTHSAVELILSNVSTACSWNRDSNYVLILGINNEDELLYFSRKLDKILIDHRIFYEPDINQFTSLSFFSTDETDKLTDGMPLAGLVSGTIDKDFEE